MNVITVYVIEKKTYCKNTNLLQKVEYTYHIFASGRQIQVPDNLAPNVFILDYDKSVSSEKSTHPHVASEVKEILSKCNYHDDYILCIIKS